MSHGFIFPHNCSPTSSFYKKLMPKFGQSIAEFVRVDLKCSGYRPTELILQELAMRISGAAISKATKVLSQSRDSHEIVFFNAADRGSCLRDRFALICVRHPDGAGQKMIGMPWRNKRQENSARNSATSAGSAQKIADSECHNHHSLLHVAGSGGRCRALPECFGKWHTAYVRIRLCPRNCVLYRLDVVLRERHPVDERGIPRP